MLQQATGDGLGEFRAEKADATDADVRAAVRRAVCAGHFMKAARRMGASAIFMTVREPSQTVHPRGARYARHSTPRVSRLGLGLGLLVIYPWLTGGPSALIGATHAVYAELVWAGKLVMSHTCDAT